MKQFIFIFSACLLLAACGATSKPDNTSSDLKTPDTTVTLATFAIGYTGRFKTDQVLRIIKDTTILKVVDSTGGKLTSEKKTVRDTVYWIPLSDTLKENGAVLVDSTGETRMKVTYYPLTPAFIFVDYNKPMPIKKQ